jgi:hypothetical protein
MRHFMVLTKALTVTAGPLGVSQTAWVTALITPAGLA